MAETYRGHKAGSRKAAVHLVYDKDGAAAATKKAAELGLAPGTVKSWIGSWGKPQVSKQAPTSKPGDERLPISKGDDNRVHLKSAPECKGKIIVEGPQQSEIKWDSGNRTFVPNSWLESE